MPTTLDQRLFRGLSVYQDVVFEGRTVRRGSRDCPARWERIAPALADCRTLLDIGSNFGWFGLKFCERQSEGVVASVEADLRSAAVQRRVLESHRHERICLLTRTATPRLTQIFEQSGQRFDAVLCLSVLHWIAEHRAFLEGLGRIGSRLILEHPDPREQGAGIERVRHEIGAIGPYLSRCFPDRPIRLLGQTDSHLHPGLAREIWLVDRARASASEGFDGLVVPALLDLGVAWPPRSWWLGQLAHQVPSTRADQKASRLSRLSRVFRSRHTEREVARLLFTPQGIEPERGACADEVLRVMRRRIRRIPEHRLVTAGEWIRRRSRSAARATMHRFTRLVRPV